MTTPCRKRFCQEKDGRKCRRRHRHRYQSMPTAARVDAIFARYAPMLGVKRGK